MHPLLRVAVSTVLLPLAALAAEPTALPKPKPKPGDLLWAPALSDTLPAGWMLVTSEEGKFRAAFPSQPQVEHSSVDTDVGKAQVLTYSLSSDKDGSYLAVSVTSFPKDTVSRALPSKVLEGARDGSLANINGKLLSDKAMMVNGPLGGKQRFFPGRDYEATGVQDLRISTRLVLVGNRLYQIMYVRLTPQDDTFKQIVSTFALRL